MSAPIHGIYIMLVQLIFIICELSLTKRVFFVRWCSTLHPHAVMKLSFMNIMRRMECSLFCSMSPDFCTNKLPISDMKTRHIEIVSTNFRVQHTQHRTDWWRVWQTFRTTAARIWRERYHRVVRLCVWGLLFL
jgi:hypothetical protein